MLQTKTDIFLLKTYILLLDAHKFWNLNRKICDIFVNCNWVAPGGSGTVHIYTQTIHITTEITTKQQK